MNTTAQKDYQHKILTIPNFLSLFRLCLIPVFSWLYIVKKDMWLTAATLALSGITDMADGYIARHFHMISDLGKALDPVADKLTQAAMLLCLILRFPLMLLLLSVLIVKEVFNGALGLLILHKTGNVYGADWHGKVATALLYATMILHVLWYNIPSTVSTALILSCVAMLLLSQLLYAVRNIRILKAAQRETSAK